MRLHRTHIADRRKTASKRLWLVHDGTFALAGYPRVEVDRRGVRTSRPHVRHGPQVWRRRIQQRRVEQYALWLLMKQMAADGEIQHFPSPHSWAQDVFMAAPPALWTSVAAALAAAQADRGWASARDAAAQADGITARQASQTLTELCEYQYAEAWVPAGTTRYFRLTDTGEQLAA